MTNSTTQNPTVAAPDRNSNCLRDSLTSLRSDRGLVAGRDLVKARQVCATLFLALLQAALDQREDDHQGGEEGDYAEAEEGHRLVGGRAGEADSLLGEGRGGGDEHQGPDRQQGGGEALHERKSSGPRGVGAAA